MAHRLMGARPIQPTGFLKTRLPGVPQRYGSEFDMARSAWSGGTGPGVGTMDGLGRMTPWGQQIGKYNTDLGNAIQSADKESPNYLKSWAIQNERNMYAAGGRPTVNGALARGQLGAAGENKWVAQPTGAVFSQFGGQIPLQKDYNTALKDARLVKHGGITPMEVAMGMLGVAGIPGMLLGKLPAWAQTLAKVGGGLSKAYSWSRGKGTGGDILGIIPT